MNPLEARMNWDSDCFCVASAGLSGWQSSRGHSAISSWKSYDIQYSYLNFEGSEFRAVCGRTKYLWLVVEHWIIAVTNGVVSPTLKKHLELQGGWKGETLSQLKWQNGEQANVACHFFKTAYRCFEYGPMTANYISKQKVRIGNCLLFTVSFLNT